MAVIRPNTNVSLPTTLPSRPVANVGSLAPAPASRPSGIAPYIPPTTAGGRSGWETANDFLGSPAGKLALGGVQAGIGMYAQGKQGDAQRQFEEEQARLRAEAERESMLAKLAIEQSQNRTNRAIAANRPIGEAQTFAASMGKGNMILDLLGKGPTAPSNPAIASQANLDNLRFNPDSLARMRNVYSEPATLQSLLSRDQSIAAINPSTAPTNYASLAQAGNSPLTESLLSQFKDYRTGAQEELEDSESYARRLLAQAIDGTSAPVGTAAGGAAKALGGGSAANPFRKGK